LCITSGLDFFYRLFPSVSGFVLLASLKFVFPFFFLILEESLQPLELDFFFFFFIAGRRLMPR